MRVAVIGHSSITATVLREWLARCPGLPDLYVRLNRSAGCFHLAASSGGRFRLQGTASALRQVYFATVDGVPVASDRSDLLAWATGAELDERMAALSLLSPGAPHTLVTRSWWQGVQPVTPGAYLQCDPDGSVRQIRWWQPPAAELSLEEGVPALREALFEAVSTRTSRAGLISADLSGGLDSTSLCFISIRKSAVPSLQLRTYVQETADPSHDDVRWSLQAAEHLGAPHRVLTVAEMPAVYDGLWPGEGVDDEWADLEQPYTVIRNRARKIFLARLLAETGSRLHIAGFGGDELFTPPPSYLHDLFRSNPALALRHLQSYRHLRRWPLAASMAALADRESYGHWVARSARFLTLAYPATNAPNFGWGPYLRTPRWVSLRAVDMAAGLLMEAVETAEPLSPSRASHLTLSMLRTGGARLRLLDRLMRRCGIALSLPYMDDRVVEAALAINRREQGGAHRYKPLLKEVMRGVAPDRVLDRRTKGEFSAEVYAGLQRNHASLTALFADSELARRGLLDPVEVRSAIIDSARRDHETTALEQTLGTEVWARAVAAPHHWAVPKRCALPSGAPRSQSFIQGGGLQ